MQGKSRADIVGNCLCHVIPVDRMKEDKAVTRVNEFNTGSVQNETKLNWPAV